MPLLLRQMSICLEQSECMAFRSEDYDRVNETTFPSEGFRWYVLGLRPL